MYQILNLFDCIKKKHVYGFAMDSACGGVVDSGHRYFCEGYLCEGYFCLLRDLHVMGTCVRDTCLYSVRILV